MEAKTSPRQAMLEMKKKPVAPFFKREEEIRGLLVALLSGEHALLASRPSA